MWSGSMLRQGSSQGVLRAESALGLERNPDLGSALRRRDVKIGSDLLGSRVHVLEAAATAHIRRHAYPVVTEGDQENVIVGIHGR